MADEKLGTFLGVFTPSILTILGVIMYLRTGWVVGNVGLLPTLVIVCLASAITLVTALSLSAIATNMRVGAGGAYYMISRSLGPEMGGAIGIPLYLSQALAVTLYAFGLAESVRVVWKDAPIQIVAAATILVVTLLCIRGAQLALRLQLPIMGLVGLSLVSLAAGSSFQGKVPLFWGDYPEAGGFWPVFAVFFPAVTGILAGVNMSGDLRDPERSIPIGVVSAVLVGLGIYLAVPILLAFNADTDTLLHDPLVWTRIAWFSPLVVAGLWGAVFSSAVGSMLGAPRILEALAADQVVPGVLAGGRLKNGQSAVAFALSVGISLAAVLLGGLNALAPLITMFFLTTYGMVNLVAGLEKLVANPSYRPRVNVPWAVSLGGALACFWVMFVINRLACVSALVVELGVWTLLHRRGMRARWGDMRQGLWLSVARFALIKLHAQPRDPRNWRPFILLFAGDVDKRLELVRFASWLNQDRGILTVCNLIEGDLEHDGKQVLEQESAIDAALAEQGLITFSEVNVVRDFEEGVLSIAQANGIGGLNSNTLMFGWSDRKERMASYFRIMRKVRALRLSIVICRIAPRATFDRTKQIDIWWRGKQYNGDMMLMLAYLLSLNPEWHGATITIKSVAASEHMRAALEEDLAKLIPRTRIAARTKVLLKPEDRPVVELMREESRRAEIVFMGLMEPAEGEESAYVERLQNMVQGFPSVVMVRNAGWFVGDLV